MTSYSFKKQVAVGKAGEQAVIAWLKGQGIEVTDVTGDAEWRQRDVDVLLRFIDSEVTAEIKTDTHTPDNLFVELTVDDKPGYLYKTRADVLLYYFPGYGRLYWLEPSALAWWVHEHAGELRRIEVKSKRGGSEWAAEGIVVPVSDLREAGLVLEYDTREDNAQAA